MAKLDLTKYGISGTTEIIHNPSYEELFVAETDHDGFQGLHDMGVQLEQFHVFLFYPDKQWFLLLCVSYLRDKMLILPMQNVQLV